MLHNYMLIFFRGLKRQKIQAGINIVGLALGLSSAMLISLYTYDELSFNTMHPHPDRTYRVGIGTVRNDGNSQKERVVPGSWARHVKDELPEAEQVLRVLHISFPTTIRNKDEDKSVLTDERRWIEASFPEILKLEIVTGSWAEFCRQPNTMIISEAAARELFGDKDPVGKILTANDGSATRGTDLDMVVTAVYKDFPLNSTFRHKYLLNLAAVRPFVDDYDKFLENVWFETYVMLHPGADPKKLEDFLQVRSAEFKEQSSGQISSAFPVIAKLTDVHFNHEATWEYTGTVGDRKYLTILSTIALLILVIACINYMNLATAKSSKRAREVGIRKSFGSSRAKLAGQFMLESALMAAGALALSLALAILLLPQFNVLANKNFVASDLFRADIMAIFAGIATFAALAGGSYPAFILSGFKPITALKGKVGSRGNAQLFRKSLVTVQYAVSISLTIVGIVIFRQVEHMHDSKLNEQGDQLMMLRFGSVAPYQKFFSLKNELQKDPEINVVSVGDAFPRLDHWGLARVDVAMPEVNDKQYQVNQLLVDFEFTGTFGVKLTGGRDFIPGSVGDSVNVLINEAAARAMNLTRETAPGKSISITLYRNQNGIMPGGIVSRNIIGVVEDFPYQNMRKVIEPLILYPNPNLRGYKNGTMVYVKLPTGKIQEKIKFVEETWKKNMPDVGLQYYFVNDLFGRLYKSEMTISSLSLNFSVLAVLITIFGLFGLASYDAERRTKEIGVRKVHGASVLQIANLFMLSFIKIFAIAAVIVVPLNYYILNNWLSTFSYKTPLGILVFGSGLGLILAITILTVGYETIRAALANPARSLRYE